MISLQFRIRQFDNEVEANEGHLLVKDKCGQFVELDKYRY